MFMCKFKQANDKSDQIARKDPAHLMHRFKMVLKITCKENHIMTVEQEYEFVVLEVSTCLIDSIEAYFQPFE